MIKRQISYFTISHFVWLQNWVFEFNCSLTFWICSVHFCKKYSFETNELLQFHRFEPFQNVSKCWKEQKRAEWIADMVPKISEFLITSWKFWEKKNILKLRWIRPGKYCCLKVYCIFFELGEPHFASRERWRNKEKTPEKIICFSLLRSRCYSSMFSSLNIWIFSLCICFVKNNRDKFWVVNQCF